MPSRAMSDVVTKALSLMEMTLANPPALGPQLTSIWATVLERNGLTPADVMRATERVIATERFFPQPAVFIEAIRPKASDDILAEAAWQRVRDCLRDYGANASLTAADMANDGAALWATERVGWERLGEMDDDNRAIIRADFVRLYRVARADGMTLDYLPGRMEKQNAGGKYDLTPALVGRPDWTQLPAHRLPEATDALGPAIETLRALAAAKE